MTNVANRLVISSLTVAQLGQFGSGQLPLNALTRQYVRDRLEYQFICVETSAEAYDLERRCRFGFVFGVKPLLNPA